MHTARVVTDLLEEWDWELLEQPRYSPDLAPADFYVFPKIKESLRIIQMESLERINERTSMSLHQLAKT